MTPYSHKIVNGETIRVPWPSAAANAKLQEFKRAEVLKARRICCAKAREAGLGHMLAEQKDGSFVLSTMENVAGTDTTAAVRQVNPLAVMIKNAHMNGLVLKDAYRKRFYAFCVDPQDPTIVVTSEAPRSKVDGTLLMDKDIANAAAAENAAEDHGVPEAVGEPVVDEAPAATDTTPAPPVLPAGMTSTPMPEEKKRGGKRSSPRV